MSLVCHHRRCAELADAGRIWVDGEECQAPYGRQLARQFGHNILRKNTTGAIPMSKSWRVALTLSTTIGPVLFLLPGRSVDAQAPEPNPRLLPVATTSQVPLTAEYDALDVPSIAAGGSYLDPTTGVQIYKLTSATYPTSDSACWPPDPNRRPVWGHDYTEGGDEVSLPYHGNTRAVVVRQEGGCGGPWWLVDFTPGVGVSNPRQLTGNLAPGRTWPLHSPSTRARPIMPMSPTSAARSAASTSGR